MAKLHIDVSGKKGLGGNWYGYDDQTIPTPQTEYLVEQGKMVGGFFNPYMRPGYLTPSVATTTSVTGVTQNALSASTVYDPINDDYYFAERGQQIFRGDGLDDITLTQVIDLGATGTPVITDIEIYQINGVRKFFYVYETGGNLEVGVSNLPFDSSSDSPTWLSNSGAAGTATGSVNATGSFVLATTTDYAFMRVADNSYAYLFADNAIHKIDGTSAGGTGGTVTANVVLFPKDFRLTDAIDYRGNMFVVVHQTPVSTSTIYSSGINSSNPCGIYIWNRKSTVIDMSDYIPLAGVMAIKKIYVAPSGEIRLITISSAGLTQIREYTGSTFKIIEEMGLGSAPQYSDSLTVTDILSVWLGTDGVLYAHGPVKSGEPDALSKIGQFKVTGTVTPETTISAGAILYGSDNSYGQPTGSLRASRQGFTIAYNDGSNKICKFYPFDWENVNSVVQYGLSSDTYSSVTLLPTLSKVNYIRIYCNAPNIDAAYNSTTLCTVSTYLNQSSTANITSVMNGVDVRKGWKYIPVNQGAKNSVFSIQFKFVWPTNITLRDSTMCMPRMIEIDYDVISKLQ